VRRSRRRVDDRRRAHRLVNSAVGTEGKVADELTVEGMDDKTADDMDSRIKSTAAVKSHRSLSDDLPRLLSLASPFRAVVSAHRRMRCVAAVVAAVANIAHQPLGAVDLVAERLDTFRLGPVSGA
jgi:hypothetical protein